MPSYRATAPNLHGALQTGRHKYMECGKKSISHSACPTHYFTYPSHCQRLKGFLPYFGKEKNHNFQCSETLERNLSLKNENPCWVQNSFWLCNKYATLGVYWWLPGITWNHSFIACRIEMYSFGTTPLIPHGMLTWTFSYKFYSDGKKSLDHVFYIPGILP